MLRGVLDPDEVAALAAEIEQSFVERDAERGRSDREEFRYQMLNHGPCSQAAVGHPAILAAIEPLLGDDCHVISNTAWRNPPEFGGGPWHCDAGPHVPRPETSSGTTASRTRCSPSAPTSCSRTAHSSAARPRSCRAATAPAGWRRGTASTIPTSPTTAVRRWRSPQPAGDVALFVSDVWHRGTPAAGGDGRLFLQVHYGRRDIAQRIRPTTEVNHLSPEAIERAVTPRQRQLVGLHDPYFYDG